jgi:hypothetical protein
MNLPPGGGTLYAAQFGGVVFHSSPGDGAYASLQQNENSYTMNLVVILKLILTAEVAECLCVLGVLCGKIKAS